MRQVTVLGSTGSIGVSCLEVMARHADRLGTFALSAHRNVRRLAEQCRRFRPRFAVITDPAAQSNAVQDSFPRETEVLFGSDALLTVAGHREADVVVSGIVGAAGLNAAWVALEAGKRLAIANKETLVVAGPLVMALARRTGAELIPVDSEHSALFQAMQAGRPNEIAKLILTASGGPFRTWTAERLQSATPEDALAHPTWQMGPKITVDSATMMNKALEVIEARWLFDLPAAQIDVVVHPQSIVHSLVEYTDGSVLAQLSLPDMKLPIQYALTYPERWPGISPRMDWKTRQSWEFTPPDFDRFPALRLGFEVAERGGTAGAVLNACNEVAVQRFLDRQFPFCEIARACEQILKAHDFDSQPTLSDLWRWDAWARQEMLAWKF